MRSVPRVLAAAVAATALLGLAAPAHADVENVTDPRGDATGPGGRSAETSADVVSTTGRHADGRVAVTLTVADLTPGHVVSFTSLVTEAARYTAVVSRFEGRTRTRLQTDDGDTVECDGLRAGLDDRRDTISVSVPRGCLDDPRWVRFGAVVQAFTSGGAWFDDARRRGGGERAIRIGQRKLRHD